MAGRPKKGEPTLSLEKIIDVAWEIVDRHGLDALSTRNLAAELDVKSPALYWHVGSKDHLLNLMIERALEGTITSVSKDLPWEKWLVEVGLLQWRTLLSHRDSGFIAARAAPTERMHTNIFGAAIATLMKAGFSERDAAISFGGLARIVIGAVVYDQNEHTRAFAESYVASDESFEYALNAYVRGLRELKREGEAERRG